MLQDGRNDSATVSNRCEWSYKGIFHEHVFADLEPNKRDQWSYVVAGSFVRFLIEAHGMDKFRALYKATPFEAGRKVKRTKDDWTEIYSPKTLQSLEADWKAMIDAQTTSCAASAALPH